MSSEDPTSTADVVDVAGESRLRIGSGADEAELTYKIDDGRLILTHTGVPDHLSGQGIGSRLVEAAVAKAGREGLTIVPRCPYAARWLRDHPDVAAGVPVDWEGR